MSTEAPAQRPDEAGTGTLLPAHALKLLWGTLSGAAAWVKDPTRQPLDPAWRWPLLGAAAAGLGAVGFGLHRKSRPLTLAGAAVLAGAGVGAVMGAAVASTRPSPMRAEEGDPWADPFFPYHRRTGLVPFGDDLWLAQQPLNWLGMEVGARMAVIRTPQGLLIYSPIEASFALTEAVGLLGEVRWIVAPNLLHNLWVADWARAFPGASVRVAPNLPERRPDLRHDGVLHKGEEAPWPDGEIGTEVVRGHKQHVEVALFHRKTGTLLVADLLQNIGHAPETRPLTRAGLRLVGMSARPTLPTDMKLTLSDLPAFQASARRILDWPVQRIVLAHGRLVTEDAGGALEDAFAFAFPGGRIPVLPD